jgi:hypothetical protein
VAADQNGLIGRAVQGEPLIAGGVDGLLSPGPGHFPAQPLARPLPCLGPRDPLGAVVVPGQLLELTKLGDGATGL